MTIPIRLAHSPDPDDAFMWWPLFGESGAGPEIDVGPFRFEQVAADIETLNRRAESAELDVTALSCAHYPAVAGRYAITACGASMGAGYGPRIVARAPRPVAELAHPGVRLAGPGARTTAHATTRLMLGADVRIDPVDFTEVPALVAAGRYDAGIVIHEGQLTFAEHGLVQIADLGAWWTERTGRPLPLGLNVVRRDLDARHGPGTLDALARVLKASVVHATEHHERSVAYALRFGRGIDAATADAFVRLYVNKWTLDFGDDGVAAVRSYLAALAEAGIVAPCTPRFVG